MERVAARQIFGLNYIGAKALKSLAVALGYPDAVFTEPEIPFSDEALQKAAREGYLLVYCADKVGEQPVTLRFLRERFGIDPAVYEPCFYNQDWYLSEPFMDRPLDGGWHLVKKEVWEESRAVQPADLLQQGLAFPPAVVCAWTFFAWFFSRGEYLWWHDFVWCSDTDHNGDRIYVGKYHDIDGVNKNGFSIHRHLALRSCYASVSYQ